MKNSKLFILVVALLGVILLSGCLTQKELMVQQGYPLAYADGFDDGCHSGKKAGGSLFDQFKKDINKFSNNTNYAQGWSDGFRQCESEQEAYERQMRMSIEQQKLDEQRRQNDLHEQYHLEHEALQGVDTKDFKYLK